MGVFVKSRHFSTINHVLWSFKRDSYDLKFLVCVVLNISNKKSMQTKKSKPTVVLLSMIFDGNDLTGIAKCLSDDRDQTIGM